MRKKLLLAALLALAAPAVWLGSSGDDLGFGKQIAGGWLVTLDLGAPVDVLGTLGADGTITGSGQLRWAGPDGTGGWMHTRYNTTAHGSWTRVGRDGISVVELLQVQDNDGNLVFYEKVHMQVTVNKDRTGMEGTGLYQLFEKGIDPLDPSSPVFAEGAFTLTGRPVR